MNTFLPRDRSFPRSIQLWLMALVIATGACGLSHAADGPKLPPLTTVSGSPRLPGKFVWADLATDNAAVAQQFYARLFGWTFFRYGDYLIAANQDRPLAGVFQRPRPKDRVAQPRWFGYISVPNVERAQEAVTQAGGRVVAPLSKVPKRGEQAVFADPEGALFGVIKSSSGDPEDFLPEPGDWIWVLLISHDGRKASEFYRGVAGYEVLQNTTTNAVGDYVLSSKGYARAAVRTVRSAQEKVRPTWLPFVRVKSIGQSVETAKELGGKVLIEPKAELFEGKLAVIADPTGAAMGIMEWKDGMLKGDR